jgi:hypothetical protein
MASSDGFMDSFQMIVTKKYARILYPIASFELHNRLLIMV